MAIIRNPEKNPLLKKIVLAVCGFILFLCVAVIALVVLVGGGEQERIDEEAQAVLTLSEARKEIGSELEAIAHTYEESIRSAAKEAQADNLSKEELMVKLKPDTVAYCKAIRPTLMSYARILRDPSWPEVTQAAAVELASLYDRFAEAFTPCSEGKNVSELYVLASVNPMVQLGEEELPLVSALNEDLQAWARECGCVSGDLSFS